MDGEDDCYLGHNNSFPEYATGSPFDPGEDKDNDINTEKFGELGDMSFYMSTYIRCVMRMMHIMRSHHMLTDVVLEVGSELFHAHKVILASASPYFKVKN